jgi:transcription antitermination factor NusG
MLPKNPCWFAVQVRRRLEKSVALGLRQKGYEEFVPMHESERLSRKTVKEEALFPGYVFCHIKADGYGLVVTTPGVIRILGSGSCPTPIDPVEINSLRLSCESGRRVVPCDFLNIGDRIMVEDGPLAGLVGILAERRNEQRAIISITQCMRSVSIEISGCKLRSLDKTRIPSASAPRDIRALPPNRAV